MLDFFIGLYDHFYLQIFAPAFVISLVLELGKFIHRKIKKDGAQNEDAA